MAPRRRLQQAVATQTQRFVRRERHQIGAGAVPAGIQKSAIACEVFDLARAMADRVD
jgi:hypothetical protein